MSRAHSIKMRGASAGAEVYTLKLDADGKAQLVNAHGASLWASDDEDDAAFHEQFGDFMEDEHADALVDWLFENVSLPESAEIEVDIEYDEDEDEDEDEDDEGGPYSREDEDDAGND